VTGFRTDADISQKSSAARANRDLQAWQPGADAVHAGPGPTNNTFAHGDDVTFGPGASNTSWDQFAANESLFGVTTQFDEDVYTTKLDRSAADFKERERKAQRLANEIIGVSGVFCLLERIFGEWGRFAGCDEQPPRRRREEHDCRRHWFRRGTKVSSSLLARMPIRSVRLSRLGTALSFGERMPTSRPAHGKTPLPLHQPAPRVQVHLRPRSPNPTSPESPSTGLKASSGLVPPTPPQPPLLLP
jgi:hypothetical protein